ncbi:putative ABC transport system substrate-binding protein [Symbiobacterium terraclitae]|uniref:ABC transport system substrate-binding protein n=1 Tax=Symbiobacterium terraclitae TaxID=557451 RepID=A0ABS4JPS3_9FIRM|nr:putative ABC transport system substrate-binding protein [Symbiobacterium terraclitae]
MRRVLAVLLTAMLVLAGCGGGSSQPQGSGSSSGSASNSTQGSQQTGSGQQNTAGPIQIGLTQIVEHPALDATRQGIIDGLAEAGYVDGQQIKIEFQSAQGEPTIAQQIAEKFVADKKDLIIAIATPSAQAAVQATKSNPIPVIFSAITDPVGAGLVADLQKPGGHVTGASDLVPVKVQMELFQRLGIDVANLGVIYNAGEANSVALMNDIRAAAGELGLSVVEAMVANAAEVQQAAQSLVGRVDGLYLITDNTLAQGVASVIEIANSRKIPAISSVESYVEQGALATLGLNYYLHGKLTAEIIVDVLEGRNPGDLPVRYNEDLTLMVNTKTAEILGLDIPAAVLEEAQKVGE